MPQPESADAPTADRIATAVRDAILAGSLRPGEPLREAQLALEHGVSRNTVREAFRLLQGDGLTDHRRHCGTVVRRIGPADIRDVYAVRRTIELRAIEMINHAGDAALGRLEQRVRDAEQARDEGRWQEVGTASLSFHRELAATLASPTLDAVMDGVLSRLRLAFAPMPDEGAFQAPWVERDRAINDLLQRGRSGAARDAMRVYLDDSENQVIGAVREYLHDD